MKQQIMFVGEVQCQKSKENFWKYFLKILSLQIFNFVDTICCESFITKMRFSNLQTYFSVLLQIIFFRVPIKQIEKKSFVI